MVFTEESFIIKDEDIYKIDIFPIEIELGNYPYKKLNTNTAYLRDGYFLLLRGNLSEDDYIEALPCGIYNKQGMALAIEPSEDEKNDYLISRFITNSSIENIIDVLKTKDTLIVGTPIENRIFNPDINPEDNILKRAIKEALKQKQIDLDNYQERFENKNSFFNFKQGLKRNDGNLSFLLFERGMKVMNLKFTLIVEEIDQDAAIGEIIKEPIIVSSQDTFEDFTRSVE